MPLYTHIHNKNIVLQKCLCFTWILHDISCFTIRGAKFNKTAERYPGVKNACIVYNDNFTSEDFKIQCFDNDASEVKHDCLSVLE